MPSQVAVSSRVATAGMVVAATAVNEKADDNQILTKNN